MADNYRFDIPTHHKSIIKVVGVGGGGSNAVNHMFNEGIEGVEFVVCNTDNQVLIKSPVPTKLPIGQNLSEGLGAGGDPEFGEKAALESKDEIRELLVEGGTKMLFITAGMGGGTGTGAAPVIAQVSKELDILTVGIVTFPFSHEGPAKKDRALAGLAKMKQYCDTVLVISNDKLEDVFGELDFFNAFGQADEVLTVAAKSIAEIITKEGMQNVDFNDVKSVMKNSGPALMGSATASGDDRGVKAAQKALESPLLENTNIAGAKKALVCVSVDPASGFKMTDFKEIMTYVTEQAGNGADLKFGVFKDEALADHIQVTVIATGFEDADISEEDIDKVIDLDSNLIIDTRVNDIPRYDANAFARTDKPVEDLPEQPITKQPSEVPSTPSEDKKVFTLEGDRYEIEEIPAAQDGPRKPTDDPIAALNERRRQLEEENAAKLQRFQKMGKNHADDGLGSFREKLEVPAYLRRNKKIDNHQPKSEDSEVSRFRLDDDNDIMGSNKFLHDNVD